MDDVVFSIVTVNLNHALGLDRTVQSLNRQALSNFEWILVDGGSKDNSLEVAESASSSFGRRVTSERDNGIYDAMNKGASLAVHPYVLFLNSGDCLHSASASESIGTALREHPTADAILFGFEYLGRRRFSRPLWWRFWALPTSHQAILYRRSILLRHPFDASLKFAGDFEQFLRLHSHGASASLVDEVIVENEEYGTNAAIDDAAREYFVSLSRYLWRPLAKAVAYLRFSYLKAFRLSR